MNLGIALEDVQRAEIALGTQLLALAQRHGFEADVYHLGLARADICVEHLARLRPLLDKYEAGVVADADPPGLAERLRQPIPAPGDRMAPTGLALLADLRDAYADAHRAEISWIMVQQAAKAIRDSELLGVAGPCLEETEQTWKWLRTRIKETAPEALATS